MLLDHAHIIQVVQNISTFHAICVAYETTEPVKLEQLFPVLDGDKGCAWFQEDMEDFLKEMYSTCRDFLKVRASQTRNSLKFFMFKVFLQSIPGHEDLSALFEKKMANPVGLHKAGKSVPSKLRSVIHGDLWHNNLFFRSKVQKSNATLK